MDTINLTKYILAGTLCGMIVLLLFLLREKQSLTRTLFAYFLAGTTLWTTAIFINLWAHSVFIEKTIFASAALFLTAQSLFAQSFPNRSLPTRPYKYWHVFVGMFFFCMSFYDGAVFSSLSFHTMGYTIVENGFLSGYYSLFAIGFVAAPILILFKTRLRTHDASLRSQLTYLLAGFSIFLGVNIFTNSILPVFFHIYFFDAIGPMFSLILAAFVFYIIWRHQFLDIRIVIQRGLVYTTLSIILLGSYLGVVEPLGFLGLPRRFIEPLAACSLFFLGTFAVYIVERYFQNRELLLKERMHIRELEEKVRERTAGIEAMRVRERQLMQDISHGVQTSLTILRGTVEHLKQKSPRKNASIVRSVEQGIERSSSLTSDLLHISQLEMQNKKQYEIIDLSALLKKVAEYVDIVCRAKRILLTQTIESGIFIRGDARQLEELVLILLSNAAKYTKPHTTGSIVLSLTQNTGEIILSVSDKGVGIPHEHIPLLFERFYRVGNNEHSGNGLGLAIAKAITEAHGGVISVQSTEGEGSEFIVRFK